MGEQIIKKDLLFTAAALAANSTGTGVFVGERHTGAVLFLSVVTEDSASLVGTLEIQSAETDTDAQYATVHTFNLSGATTAIERANYSSISGFTAMPYYRAKYTRTSGTGSFTAHIGPTV